MPAFSFRPGTLSDSRSQYLIHSVLTTSPGPVKAESMLFLLFTAYSPEPLPISRPCQYRQIRRLGDSGDKSSELSKS